MIFADPPQDMSLNEHQLRAVGLQERCFTCGARLGLHRYGDDACPNIHWKPGNWQPQYREGWRFRFDRTKP